MGRIIVIEDNPVFRDHVCGMLEKAGYKTRTAYDCAGARRLLEELDDGDIIVSDLRLPDGECTEVLERMREAGIRNPFVIMTDYAQVASAASSATASHRHRRADPDRSALASGTAGRTCDRPSP